MIKIGKPSIHYANGRAYLSAPVSIPEEAAERYREAIVPYREFCVWLTDEDYPPAAWKKDGKLWFDVPEEYGEYLCIERSNAFVVALFWYAVATGSDITFETPVSKRLYEGIMDGLLPELVKNGFPAIRLHGPVTDEPVQCAGKVVTGMSGGVDSNYTVHCYTSDSVPEEDRITHLAHYTCGHLFKPRDTAKGLDRIYREEEDLADVILENARIVAREKSLPLVDTNSNLDRDFYRGGYTYMGMYRYLASTLALEHLYKTYISSSSGHTGNIEEHASLFVPTQHYEELLCRCLRTEGFRYISSDDMSRTEKLKVVANDTVFGDTAAVCFDHGPKGENCGVCYGCLKTLIPIDLLGKLGNFKKSFDVDDYTAHRKERFAFLIDFSKRPEATSARETVKQLVELAEEKETDAGKLFLEIYHERNE